MSRYDNNHNQAFKAAQVRSSHHSEASLARREMQRPAVVVITGIHADLRLVQQPGHGGDVPRRRRVAQQRALLGDDALDRHIES